MTSNDRGAPQEEYPTCQACAGVAAEKGLGAEGRGSANPFLALRKTSVVLSQKCGELSKSRHCIIVLDDFVGRGTLLGALLPFKLKND